MGGYLSSFHKPETMMNSDPPEDLDEVSNLTENSRYSLDLHKFPTELALSVLANLDATDLCLASCVWSDLAADELLWRDLCKRQWSFVNQLETCEKFKSYRTLYLHLDEARLIFNSDCLEGVAYLTKFAVIKDTDQHIADYLHGAPGLCPVQRWSLLQVRPGIIDHLMKRQNFRKQFLPDALRQTLSTFVAMPLKSISQLERLIDRFAEQFVNCNPNMGLTQSHVVLLSFSMLILSVDLNSPHVRNKMSKREFIKNTRLATGLRDCELLGFIYDNVYQGGHIACSDTCSKLPVFNPTHIAIERLTHTRA